MGDTRRAAAPMKYYDKVATVLILQMAMLHTHVFGAVFLESFETPTQQAPAGWQVPAGSAEVVSGQTGAVGTSLKLATTLAGQAETRVVRPITGWNQTEPVAFIDFLIKPAANPEGSMASVYVNGTQIAFQVPAGSTQGQIWVYHGNDDDATGASEKWLRSAGNYTISASTQQANAFTRLTLRQDYQRKIWDLFVDGKLAAANLGFDGRDANLASIEFYGSDVADLHLDQLQADPSNLLFPDADKDGLPDAWETANGSNPNLYDRDAKKPNTDETFLELYTRSLWWYSVPNGADDEGASSASIPPLTVLAAHKAVGSLKGSLSVGGDGSAAYSIPIDIPKGTAGMEPKLSLNYSSGGGNGMYGVGWSLGGLQKITRGPASAAKDGNYDPVDFDEYDRYFLDGERLICVAGTYGAAGSEYRTEMDSYARITLNGTAPGNLWWKLETKAGLIVELGNTTDSREAAVGENGGASPGILSWSVNRVADTCGNYYAIQYATDSASGYSSVDRRVSRLDYTGGPNLTPYCSVEFDYETRPDQGRAFTPHAGYLVTKRLAKIRVKTGSFTNHSYRLAYQNSWQSGRSFLTTIQKFVNDDNALGIPASTFTYDGLVQGQPIWQDSGFSNWPFYGPSWDAAGAVNSMVTLGDTSDEVRLNGNVSRVWTLPSSVTLHADSKLTFKFKGENFVTGAYIGLETDSTYQSSPSRLCLIRGSGSPVSTSTIARAREVIYAPDASGWQTITFDVGALATGVHTNLALINIDNSSSDGISNATFKDVRIYRSGSQQPGDVTPLAFTVQGELLELNQGSDDWGVRFIDLDGDGLSELCDWRALRFQSSSGTYSGSYLVKTTSPETVGQVYRNTGVGFVADTALRPPSYLPLSSRHGDTDATKSGNRHHLFASPVDINGDGRPDLLGSTNIQSWVNPSSLWSLSNDLTFHTWVNGSWQELTAYKLPFRPKNVYSSVDYGGYERDHHVEWLDLDSDGYTDLLCHTTSKGMLVSVSDEQLVLSPGNATTAWLNKVHLGQGWVRRDELGLREALRLTQPDPKDIGRRLQDINGDGRPDMVESVVDGSNNTRHTYFLNTAANGTLTGWNSTVGQQNPPASLWDLPKNSTYFEKNAPFVNASGVPKASQFYDLNGDGLPDIERTLLDSGVFKKAAWLNHGAAMGRWVEEPLVSASVPQGMSYLLPRPLNIDTDGNSIPVGYEWADLNGDGLVDIFYCSYEHSDTPGGDNLAILNTGSGWMERAEWGGPAGASRIFLNPDRRKAGQRSARLQDLNGDGFPDLITGLINDTQKVWLNQCKKEVLTSVTDGFGTTLGIEYKRLNDPSPVAGGTSRVFQPYTGTLPAGHAVSCGPQLVVSRLIEPDGLGGQTIARHYYGDLRSDRTNESSLGFGWTEVYKDLYPAVGGVIPRGYSRTETARVYPFGGSVVKSESFVHVGQSDSRLPGVTTGYKRVSVETSTYGELAITVGVGGTVRRPVQTGSVSERYDLDGTLMARTTATQALADFDAYGFLKKSTVAALDGSTTVTTNTYAHNTVGKWHLGRLSESTVSKTAPGKASSLKKTAFTYHSTTGLLLSEVVEPNRDQAVTTTYTHDDSGNVLSKTVSTGDGSRSTENTYDANGRFAVSETTVGLGSTSTVYDTQRALVTSTADLDGLVTTFDYDAYGTQIAVNKADGTRSAEITRYASNANLPGPVASQLGNQTIRWAKTAQSSGSPWASVYYDAFGREVAKETSILTSFDGTTSVWRDVYVVTQHDNRGRKVKASQPFFAGETPLWTTIGYDPVDRPMITTYPDGTSDAVMFHDNDTLGGQPVAWSKIKNRNNQQLERWEDQHGRMVQSKDPSNQFTTFNHDVEGRLLQVQIDGTTLLANTWDIFGRKTGVTDIDAGSSSSAYNAFGEVVSTTNALGQTTTTAYDSLGRVASVTKPEGTYTTTYRTISPAKGKPASIAGPNGYSESFGYDSYGRVTSTSTTRFGETFTTQTTYDALGRVSSETNAGGLTLVHDYDTVFSAKIRTRETATNTTLWEPRAVDSQGRVIQQKLAHGVETIRTPNPANGTLTSIYSTGQGQVLQNLAYTWDPNGNLTFRADSLAGRNETFGYDTLNRLTSAAVAGQSAATYTYAANGNLLTKAGDTLTYGGSRIHAVTAATIKGESRSYAYDAAGRVTSDTARTYGWSSFHQLAWVSQLSCPRLKSFDPLDAASSGIPGIAQAVQYLPSQGVTQFDFDASGSRARQFLVRTFADTSTADATTLYLGSYEREIHRTTAAGSSTPVTQKTLHRHNLGGAIYTIEQTAGNSPVHKLATILTDHLDSTDVLLIGTWNGSVWSNFQSERQSFNPWGERRNANTWASLRTGSGDDRQTSGANYKRGFTGHEMLDDFGLIHMNGRIYDPELGRFLSADPYVQVPEYSQNFNRYSYVLNNPLTYTDPSGHKISGLWAAIAMVVIAVVAWYVAPMVLGALPGTLGATLGGTTLTALAAQGAFIGFVSGAAGGVISGASGAEILKGALVGAITGAIAGGVLHGLGNGDLLKNLSGVERMLMHTAGHGVLGGASNEIMGGRFQDGFLSGLAGAAATYVGPLKDIMAGVGDGDFGRVLGRAAIAGVVGGTAAAIGGGKFANGAVTAAFQYLTNEAAAQVRGLLPSRPCIQCHGVSAQGYSGNPNDFELGTVMSPVMEEGLHAYVAASKETAFITGKAAMAEIALQATGAKVFRLLGSVFATANGVNNTTGTIKVIGRLDDTANYAYKKGFEVIEAENWSVVKNFRWVDEGVKNSQIFKLASPVNWSNLYRASGSYMGPTMYARELHQLARAGYTRVGNYMHPPKL
jgi:RHS repeat-associated protein